MLRRGSALALVLTPALAAMRILPPSFAAPHDLVAKGKLTKFLFDGGRGGPTPNFVGGCTAYSVEYSSHLFPYDENRGQAKKILDTFFASPTPYGNSRPIPADVRYLIALAMFAAVFALYDYMSRQPVPKYVPYKAHQMASNISTGK